MKREELTKTFMMISNCGVYTKISALKELACPFIFTIFKLNAHRKLENIGDFNTLN